MKQVYTHPILAMVQQMANVLELRQVPSEVRNQYAAGAAGELAFVDSWPQLVVDDIDFQRALRFVDQELKQTGEDWVCPQCKEHNGFAFGACWQCGSTHPEDAI